MGAEIAIGQPLVLFLYVSLLSSLCGSEQVKPIQTWTNAHREGMP